jgi:hypothetical protein
MSIQWKFDQSENVAALTTRQVLEQRFPILRVVHHRDDHSWAFTCGTTRDPRDIRVVGMGEIVGIDETLHQVADLLPGWGAWRDRAGGDWQRYEARDF